MNNSYTYLTLEIELHNTILCKPEWVRLQERKLVSPRCRNAELFMHNIIV